MRKYKKVFIIIASSILFLVLTAIALSIVYEKKITDYLVSELNSRMEAEIKASKINFSLLEKFPFASIRLDSMSVVPKNKLLPSLYSAKTTFLEFNIIDMFSGNYSIRNIDIRKGSLNVVTINGKSNYELFKESGKEGMFNFALRNVRVADLSLSVSNQDNGFNIRSFVSSAFVKGKFSESEYDISASIKGKVKEINKRDVSFIKAKEFELASELFVKSSVYSIKNCKLNLQGLNFTVEGDIKDKEDLLTDLKIRGEDIGIVDLYKLLPENLIGNALDDYESEGNLDFTAAVSGPVSESALSANFKIKKGKLIYKAENLELRNISLTGKIDNGKSRTLKTTRLQLSDFYAETNGGRVSGNLILKDLNSPELDLNIKAKTSFEQIMPFIKQEMISHAKGQVDIQAHYSGPLKKAKTVRDLAAVRSGGMIRLKNVDINLKSDPVIIKDLNAVLLVEKNDLMINSLDLDFNGSKFSVTGHFANLVPSLFAGDEKMKAFLDLKSSNADLSAFLKESKEGTSGGNSTLAFPFSEGRMNMTLGKAHYERFEASSVTGTLNLQDNRLTAENIQFETMNGRVRFNGAADFMIKGIQIKGHALLDQINISNLFYVFNNFGQDALTDKHIKGDSDAEINFTCFWNHKLVFDPLSLNALCDVSIEKGELNGFVPLYQLSNFISLNELKNIRFSKLHNNFIVKDGKVIFPDMEINSSAMNLTCSGTHYFSNKVDYHFELSLNDFLWQKVKTAKPVNQEFGIEEDDGLGKVKLHLSMSGDIDNPHFAYDRRSMRKDLQEEARAEKIAVKGLLKKDLGLFKTDSTIKAPATRKEKSIGIDWNDGENPERKTKEEERKKDEDKLKEKGKVGKLLDKIAKPGSEEKSGESTDDFN